MSPPVCWTRRQPLAALPVVLVVLLLGAAGCTSSSRSPAPAPEPADRAPAGTGASPEPAESGETAAEAPSAPRVAVPAPWQLPAGSAPSQRLFRLRFEGPQGDGTLRLVLRLASSERYRLSVSDRLGRPVYTLSAAPGTGLLLDHRRRRFCALPGSIRVEGVPVDPLPLPALPRLLLGRLPVPPAEAPGSDALSSKVGEAAEEVEVVDSEGRRWTAVTADGDEVASWILWEQGEPAAWWRALAEERVLSDRVRGVQMTWREVAREALPLPLDVVGIPAGFAEGGCGDLLEAAPPTVPTSADPPTAGTTG